MNPIEMAMAIEAAGGMESIVKDEKSGLWIIPVQISQNAFVPEFVTFRQLAQAEKVLSVKARAGALR